MIDQTLPDAKKKEVKISFAHKHLLPCVKATREAVVDEKEAVEWENGSSVYVGTSHRGTTLQILHHSELGKIAVRFPERVREIKFEGAVACCSGAPT